MDGIFTFEMGEADVLASQALDVLDTVDDDWSTENVTQGEYVSLFERSTWLVGERENVLPILFQLVVVKRVVKRLSQRELVLFPSRLEA